MSLINWENNYSVGVKELDDQHKKLFKIINKLFDSMRSEFKNMKIREKLLLEMLDYGKIHLDTEEKYFEKYNYPEKDYHTRIHDAYRAKTKEFLGKKDETFLSFEMIDFLEDWWLKHITTIDKEYQNFFNEKWLK